MTELGRAFTGSARVWYQNWVAQGGPEFAKEPDLLLAELFCRYGRDNVASELTALVDAGHVLATDMDPRLRAENIGTMGDLYGWTEEFTSNLWLKSLTALSGDPGEDAP